MATDFTNRQYMLNQENAAPLYEGIGGMAKRRIVDPFVEYMTRSGAPSTPGVVPFNPFSRANLAIKESTIPEAMPQIEIPREELLQPPPQQAPIDPYAQVPDLPQYGAMPQYEQDPRAAMLQQIQLQQLEPQGVNPWEQAAQYGGAILGEDPVRDVGQVVQQRGQQSAREEMLRQQGVGQQLGVQAQEAQKARDIQFAQEQQLRAEEFNQALAERNEIINAIEQQYKREQDYADIQEKATQAEKLASVKLAQGGYTKMADTYIKRLGKDPKKVNMSLEEIGEQAAKKGGQLLIDFQRDWSSLPDRANLVKLEELVDTGSKEEAELALLLYLNAGQNPKLLSKNARNIIKGLK